MRSVGAYLRGLLSTLRDKWPEIADVSGRGLMLGLELAEADGSPWSPAHLDELRKSCEREGLLLNTTRHTVNLMPPLILDYEDADELVTMLDRAISSVAGESALATRG